MKYEEELFDGAAVDKIVDWTRIDAARNFRNVERNVREHEKEDFSLRNKRHQSKAHLNTYIEPKVKMWLDESFIPTAEQILSGSNSERLNVLAQVFRKTEHDHTLLGESAIDNMLVGKGFLATRYCLRKLLERPGFRPTQKQRNALFKTEGLSEGSPEIADFLRRESAKWGAEQAEKMKKTGDIAKSEMPKVKEVKVEKPESMLDRIKKAEKESNAMQNRVAEINDGFEKMTVIKPEGEKTSVRPGYVRKI
jgi:hypothetical protein